MPDHTKTDLEILNAMQEASILVIGDIMLDKFIYGHVERISPESPVPVLSVSRENMMLGGAGNTLVNLMNLNCQGKILSVVGADEDGKKVTELAKTHGIDVEGLLVDDHRPTIVKTRYLAGHQQLLRTDYERTEALAAELEARMLDKADGLMKHVDAVILSDYGKGLLSPSLIQALIEKARAFAIPVLVDPKGTDYSIYKGADVVTPNKKELKDSTGGLPVSTDAEVIHAAQTLLERSGIRAVVATRSKDGMSVIEGNDKMPVHVRSASDIEVFDVSGAGDTVIATIAAALAAGANLPQAASIANVAGSIVVSKVGTAPIRAQELHDRLSQHDAGGDIAAHGQAQPPRLERLRHAPILGWEEASEEVQRWKARGLKVGFTNGCFDVLHYGHVTYLNDTRQKCDRLVLGLNRDSSIRILKGPARPVHDEQSRAAVIAALGSVDMVVLFGAQNEGEDNTAIALLEMLQPDIYFKGGDYTVDEIPEAPTVLKAGGIVDVMPVYEGHSSTSSIEKMKKA